ncbi:MAG: hypothetical protein Q8O99_05065 [bacterium]|nr:hypothetical protein [bacterium]
MPPAADTGTTYRWDLVEACDDGNNLTGDNCNGICQSEAYTMTASVADATE